MTKERSAKMWIHRFLIQAVALSLAMLPSVDAQAQKPSPPAQSGSAAVAPAKGDFGRVRSKKRKVARPVGKPGPQRWPTKRPAVSPAPLQIPAMGAIPFPPGERLAFKIQILGVQAGEVMLGVGAPTMKGEIPVVPLVGWIRSSSAFSKVYSIDDRLEVLVDQRTFLPLRSDFYIAEAGKKLSYHTEFNQAGKLISSRRVQKKDRDLVRDFTPVREVYDAMSSVYAARRMNLVPGLKFAYYIWDGRKERLISVVVVGQEKIYTELGWFDCMKIELVAATTGGFMSGKELNEPAKKGAAWIALDAARTPVKVVTETRIGDVTGEIYRRFVDPKDAAAAARLSPQAAPTTP